MTTLPARLPFLCLSRREAAFGARALSASSPLPFGFGLALDAIAIILERCFSSSSIVAVLFFNELPRLSTTRVASFLLGDFF